MEFDKDTHDKIVEMALDIKYIREKLGEGKETFKEHAARIRQVEQNQQLLTGKVAVVAMLLGACVLFITNLIARLWK